MERHIGAGLALGLLVAMGTGCTKEVWDLGGTWTGDIQCGSALDYTLELGTTNEAFESDGTGNIQFTDADGNPVDVTFTIEVSFTEPERKATSVALEMDIDDCEEASFGPFICFGSAGTWDVTDDEISGGFDDFIITGADCEYTVER